MPSASFAGGSLRITTPESYDAAPGSRRTSRALPGEPGFETAAGRDALLGALSADTDLTVVERVDLTPRRSRGTDTATPGSGRGTVRLDVDVPPGEDAVVLLERDGVYSWHLPTNPTNPAERTRDLDPAPRTARFEIDVVPSPPPRAPARRRRGTTARADRGILGDLVSGAVQAIVYRFVAPAVLGRAIEAMEKPVRTGLVHVTSGDATGWRPFEGLDELGLPTGRPVRILLLVHGTFSSTVGCFAALGLVPGAEAFLPTVIDAYDAVVGYDHRTLSLDPAQNAEDLLARLSRHHPESELVIDVVTHSRGGLVTRSFVESVLPQSDWPARVDTIVFVAATNGGTHLADPTRWCDLVDLYTNLAAVGAGWLAALPGGAPVGAVVGGAVKAIGAFVKFLVTYAAQGQEVPGLSAMVPEGPFVTTLNGEQPGQPGPGTSWFVVSSDFHVTLFDESHHPAEFPKELAVRLAEGVADQLFKGPNDLVVDTASMDRIGGPDGGFVRDRLELGTNDVVYHTNYFAQMRVIEGLAGWLPLGMGAGGEPTGAEPPDDVPADLPADAPLEPGDRDLPAAEPPDSMAQPPPPPPTDTTDGPPPAAPTTAARLAAEMPGAVTVRRPFTVRVRLARGALRASEGSAHVEETVQVRVDQPVSVHVVGKANAVVVGEDVKEFGLPSGDWTSELTFDVRPLARGPVVVTVVVRQGRLPVATLSLESVAAAAGEQPDAVAGVRATKRPRGIDAPGLERLPCLEVFEQRRAGGKVVYQYALRTSARGRVHRFESLPVTGSAAFAARRVEQVADAWRNTRLSREDRLADVQDIGTDLFERLFPAEMQRLLWARRDRLRHLLLLTDEPYIPWELVHLKPPDGPRGAEPRFLAQGGLVRWHFDGVPPREMRVRTGRARSLCPEYADPAFTLRGPAEEARFLAERLGATPVRATPSAVRELLRSGGFDLLHFAGHGAADSGAIDEARVLLAAGRRGTENVQKYLTATNVSANAKWARKGRPGPVVVLNACQVGRAGRQLTTVGGFAKAFLDAGASAFVSCLWSVHDELSRVFVEAFYDGLLAGRTVGEASARARQAARRAGDETWLAYVVYGNPEAVLVDA